MKKIEERLKIVNEDYSITVGNIGVTQTINEDFINALLSDDEQISSDAHVKNPWFTPASSITNVPITFFFFASPKNDPTEANVVEITGTSKNRYQKNEADCLSKELKCNQYKENLRNLENQIKDMNAQIIDYDLFYDIQQF